MSEVKSDRNNDLVNMLTSDDKWINKSGNFLTLLARTIMFDMRLTPRQYWARIELWLKSRMSVEKVPLTKISSLRNNFTSEVTHHNMTANTFQKFTEALGASRMTVTIKMEFNDGRPDHTSSITFSNITGKLPADENEES